MTTEIHRHVADTPQAAEITSTILAPSNCVQGSHQKDLSPLPLPALPPLSLWHQNTAHFSLPPCCLLHGSIGQAAGCSHRSTGTAVVAATHPREAEGSQRGNHAKKRSPVWRCRVPLTGWDRVLLVPSGEHSNHWEATIHDVFTFTVVGPY